jgi:transcriptional regulator with XRE-family HTH domain
MDELDGRIGDYLRTLRRHADLSQRELATRAGVPVSTVARLESGASTDPRVSTLRRLAAAAGADLALLVDGVGIEPHRDVLGWRDRAGRRLPAHLDPEAVMTIYDWWCSIRTRHHPPLPAYTYTAIRSRRDVLRAALRRVYERKMAEGEERSGAT